MLRFLCNVTAGSTLQGRCVKGVIYFPFFCMGGSCDFGYNNRTPQDAEMHL